MPRKKKLTRTTGAPVADNQNALTAGPRGPMLLQDVCQKRRSNEKRGGLKPPLRV